MTIDEVWAAMNRAQRDLRYTRIRWNWAHRVEARVRLRRGRAQDFPAPRDHAYTRFALRGIEIVYAPKLEEADLDRVQGVLAHEAGHAYYMLVHGDEQGHTERDADKMSAAIFGRVVRYDDEDVQTWGEGVVPRPRRLPQ